MYYRPNIEARWTEQGAGFWLRRIAAGERMSNDQAAEAAACCDTQRDKMASTASTWTLELVQGKSLYRGKIESLF